MTSSSQLTVPNLLHADLHGAEVGRAGRCGGQSRPARPAPYAIRATSLPPRGIIAGGGRSRRSAVANANAAWPLRDPRRAGHGSDEVLAAIGLPTGHDYMSFAERRLRGGTPVVVCRTGYTGERGYELVVPSGRPWPSATRCWRPGSRTASSPPASARATPCGPRWATRCTARTSRRTSRRSRLGSAGRSAGRRTRSGATRPCARRRRPARPGCLRACAPSAAASRGPAWRRRRRRHEIGEVTSGTFSPTLKNGIALALLDAAVKDGDQVEVDVRGRQEPFEVVKPPFVTVHVRES